MAPRVRKLGPFLRSIATFGMILCGLMAMHCWRVPQVCIIRWAGTDKQQVWRGCIDNIVDITQGESLSPCIIVVGQVAGSV